MPWRMDHVADSLFQDFLYQPNIVWYWHISLWLKFFQLEDLATWWDFPGGLGLTVEDCHDAHKSFATSHRSFLEYMVNVKSVMVALQSAALIGIWIVDHYLLMNWYVWMTQTVIWSRSILQICHWISSFGNFTGLARAMVDTVVRRFNSAAWIIKSHNEVELARILFRCSKIWLTKIGLSDGPKVVRSCSKRNCRVWILW